MKTYYKVVRQRNKKLYSGYADCWCDSRRKPAIRYIRNKWTYPKEGANQFLFVFDNLTDAKTWAIGYDVIYVCEVGKVLKRSYHRKIYGIVYRGTRLVDKVKITKKVR
jgi:hypothetical protein